jgi:hypothetical protein
MAGVHLYTNVEREVLTIIDGAEWLSESTSWKVANRRQDGLLEKWKWASCRL